VHSIVKVLMLITSLAGGGAERVASELSLYLSPNIQRRIITLASETSYPSKYPYNMSPLSMNFNLKGAGFINIVYVTFMGIIKYRKILKNYKPDVSMSFLVLDNFINVLSNIGNKKTKVIVSVHSALSIKFSNSIIDRFAKFLVNILYNKADLVIPVSKGVEDELIKDFKIDPEKIKLIYSPTDIEKIQHLAKDEVNFDWFDDEIPILINMGRLTQAKGQWHLIRAFSKVIEKKQCKLVICGKGELKQYLENLVRDLYLTNDVKFLGWQDNPFKYISKASIFILSSIREAFPLTLGEAMACGCPIISTDCKYGPSEILGNGKFGILIPPLDGIFYKASDLLTPQEEYLVNEINRLLDDLTLRKKYSEKSKIRVMDFDFKNSIGNYEKILMGEILCTHD